MNQPYGSDLAYIHDVGFSAHALKSAPGILAILQQAGLQGSLIVDLGCGTGLSAQAFTQAGYQVLGIDLSSAMVEIARRRVPTATFRVESLLQAALPSCGAVTAIGECFNYLFDPTHNRQTLRHLFGRIYHALMPGGMLIFDSLTLGQIPPGTPTKTFMEGADWVVLVEKSEDPIQQILTRRILSFRQVGDWFRRDQEIHRQQLYDPADLEQLLQQVGFEVEVMDGYGDYCLPQGRVAFRAQTLSGLDGRIPR
ncbi:MAG: methyltransferase domain-containing protein [Oscillatoriales cyanobacterium RM1_1_9]|nr:methyltransferase domain-containing protein [Oscillatoriales cyanobacterium SM2_3_0]NJO47371.1 methyltransferase domain-containing protein [Oscillatoriales cyanobacterium RM2_1_1]NJO71748.1 methyltransferase domain-containing protein [Oscillatoriales cyanobacterium RM1_1_9]